MIAIRRAFIKRRLRQKWIFYTSPVAAAQSRKPRKTRDADLLRQIACIAAKKKEIIKKTPSTIASTLAVASFKDHVKLSARLSRGKSDKRLNKHMSGAAWEPLSGGYGARCCREDRHRSIGASNSGVWIYVRWSEAGWLWYMIYMLIFMTARTKSNTYISIFPICTAQICTNTKIFDKYWSLMWI